MQTETTPLLDTLDEWVAARCLRPLDRALAAFLQNEGGEQDPQVLLLAALTSQQLGSGHICLDLERLLETPDALFASEDGEETQARPLSALLADTDPGQLTRALENAAVVDTGPGTAPLVLSGHRLYLRRYWQYEQTVAARLLDKLAVDTPPPADLSARLDKLFPGQDDDTDWQKVACALASRSALTVITGGPGTGKTTTVVRLLGLLQSVAVEQARPLRIKLAAPTGKAAARLTESIGGAVDGLDVPADVRERIPTDVTTLHKLLGRRPDSRHFRHDRHNPLHADLVVVDEASMIDLEMMASLLEALRPRTRLILLGDKDQLSSVEAGAVLGDLCRHADRGNYTKPLVDWVREQAGEDIAAWQGKGDDLDQHIAMLRRNWRFRHAPGIGALAAAVNAGDPAATEAVWREGHDDIDRTLLSSVHDRRLEQLCVDGYRPYLEAIDAERPGSPDMVDNWAKEILAVFGRFQLLCALRRGPAGVEGLNRRVANALHDAGLVERTDGWYEGRPVIVTRNDYQLGLMNGDVGVALKVPEQDGEPRLRVAFQLPNGDIRLVLPSRLDSVETVYAMTVHKSQGSEFDHTALILPDQDNPVVTRELLYTAVTRGKQRFTLLAPDADIAATAITRRTWRASGLAEALTRQDPVGSPWEPR